MLGPKSVDVKTCVTANLGAADLAFLLLGGSTMDVAPRHNFEVRETAPPAAMGSHPDLASDGAPGLEACYTSPSGVVYRPDNPASCCARIVDSVVDALQGLAGLEALELTFFDPKVVALMSKGLPGVKVRLEPFHVQRLPSTTKEMPSWRVLLAQLSLLEYCAGLTNSLPPTPHRDTTLQTLLVDVNIKKECRAESSGI